MTISKAAPMTPAKQPAEATDYAEKARELALSLCGGDEDEHAPCIRGLGPEGKCSCVRDILTALQSAHAAGKAEGDALNAKLEKARERISNLEKGIGPCGCDLGACEQYPETDAVYYGRLCRAILAEIEADMPKEAEATEAPAPR